MIVSGERSPSALARSMCSGPASRAGAPCMRSAQSSGATIVRADLACFRNGDNDLRARRESHGPVLSAALSRKYVTPSTQIRRDHSPRMQTSQAITRTDTEPGLPLAVLHVEVEAEATAASIARIVACHGVGRGTKAERWRHTRRRPPETAR